MVTPIARPWYTHFWGPAALALVLLALFVIAWNWTVRFSTSEAQARESIAQVFTLIPDEIASKGLQHVQASDLRFTHDAVVLTARVDASMFGNTVEASFVAYGKPVYHGPSWWRVLGNALGWTSMGPQAIAYEFNDIDIEEGTFKINDAAAIEQAIPAGQGLVARAANTKAGMAFRGFLGERGADTSDEAIERGTANLMRKYEEPLIDLFTLFLRNHVNNKAVFDYSELAGADRVAAVFRGFSIEPGMMTIHFYLAWLAMAVGVALFTAMFGIGWWIARAIRIARDHGTKVLRGVSDEVADIVGDVVDAAVDLTKSG